MEKFKKILKTSLLIFSFVFGSCQEQAKNKKSQTEQVNLSGTIGEISEIYVPEPIGVEGYALVGGLRDTGSSQCPPQIRNYLQQYLLKNLPGMKNTSELINSPDTAVVYVSGTMPPVSSKGDNFDVKVAALPGTETTSLEGGVLWGADLREKGRFTTTTKVLAKAEGQVYIDKIDANDKNNRSGLVLAGGRVIDDYQLILVIRQKDYRLTSRIRDQINGRFGSGTAKAVLSGQINVIIPAKYKLRKQKFVSLVQATYITEDAAAINQRVEQFIRSLETAGNKDAAEISLEAIGNIAADKLAGVLNSPDAEVRFRAARCLMNMGDDRGLGKLREIVFDKTSPYRKEAIETIGASARRNDATAVLQRVMRDDDFQISLAAFDQLNRLDDISITRKLIGRTFYLKETAGTKKKSIYVSRSGQPYIVLFGAPMYCIDGSFIQSDDGNITINALPGAGKVSLTRKIAGHPPITVQSSHNLSDIIETLCNEATVPRDSSRKPGVNIPYSDMIALLKKMCEKGAVQADFHFGKLAQID
jgi:hypothetical protein